MALDVVNSRTLELEAAKEILAELFDIRTHEVDENGQAEDGRESYGKKFYE
jgi:hypothetical protein